MFKWKCLLFKWKCLFDQVKQIFFYQVTKSFCSNISTKWNLTQGTFQFYEKNTFKALTCRVYARGGQSFLVKGHFQSFEMFLGPQIHSKGYRGSKIFENFSADLWKSQEVPKIFFTNVIFGPEKSTFLSKMAFKGVPFPKIMSPPPPWTQGPQKKFCRPHEAHGPHIGHVWSVLLINYIFSLKQRFSTQIAPRPVISTI